MKTVNDVLTDEPIVELVQHEEFYGTKAVPIKRAALSIEFPYEGCCPTVCVALDIPTALKLQRQICNLTCDALRSGVCVTEAGYQEQLDKAGVDGARNFNAECSRT